MTMIMNEVKHYVKYSMNECVYLRGNDIYIWNGTFKPSRRCQRFKCFNIPKRVAKFDCMHVPGRRQNNFLANVFGKISR